MFIVSLFLFAIFTLATGFLRITITLDVLKGILGLMSASTIASAQGILGRVYEKPSKRKNHAFAYFSAGNPLALVSSSVFSGIATQLFSWRASFWLLAIIYLVVAVTACFVVPVDDSEKLLLTVQSWKQFDAVGAGLTIGGLGLFSTGLR